MKMLTKDQILAAHDLETKVVDVPAWGGSVTVSELSANSRAAWEELAFDDDGKPLLNGDSWTAKLVAACMVDSDGNRLFSDEDAAALGKKSDVALKAVYKAAAELNGLGKTAKEDAEKN